jgi:exocyst complex component 6
MPPLQQILPPLTHELLGFFVIELEVLRTTVGFRSMLQVEEVWQDVVRGLIELVENGLRSEKDGSTFVTIKDTLTTFLQVIEACHISPSMQGGLGY